MIPATHITYILCYKIVLMFYNLWLCSTNVTKGQLNIKTMTPKQRGGKRAGAGSPPKYIGKTKKKLIPIAVEEEVDRICEPYLNKRK